MWTYILGPILSLLPERWRANWRVPANWSRATMISGFLEAVGCAYALVSLYMVEIQRLVDQQTATTAGEIQQGKDFKGLTNIELAYSQGMSGLLTFLENPFAWLLIYCVLEGAWRAFTALNDESRGTGILGVFDWIARRLAKRG